MLSKEGMAPMGVSVVGTGQVHVGNRPAPPASHRVKRWQGVGLSTPKTAPALYECTKQSLPDKHYKSSTPGWGGGGG